MYRDNEVNLHEPYSRTTTDFMIHLRETEEFYYYIL